MIFIWTRHLKDYGIWRSTNYSIAYSNHKTQVCSSQYVIGILSLNQSANVIAAYAALLCVVFSWQGCGLWWVVNCGDWKMALFVKGHFYYTDNIYYSVCLLLIFWTSAAAVVQMILQSSMVAHPASSLQVGGTSMLARLVQVWIIVKFPITQKCHVGID